MKNFLLHLYRSKPIYNHRSKWILLILCSIFVILRLPSLIEPHWYGDEGIYQVVGRALNQGRVLYRDIWDNKPPILYIIYAVAGGSLFTAKLFSLLAGLFSVIIFHKLSKKLFKKPASIYIATGCYVVLFGSPILEGNIANAENFMLLPIVCSAYLVYLYVENRKLFQLAVAGVLLSIALMTKIVTVFDFSAFALVVLVSNRAIKIKEKIKPLLIFTGFFLSVFLFFIVNFLLIGTFRESLNSILFMYAVVYCSSIARERSALIAASIATRIASVRFEYW